MTAATRLPSEDDPSLMPYQRIARLIRRHRELSRGARDLAKSLALVAGPDGSVWFASVEMLADELAVTAATVRRLRSELVAAGVIDVTSGGGSDTNVYRFRLPVVVHTPRADARGTDESTPRADARGPRAWDARTPRVGARHRERDEVEKDRSFPTSLRWCDPTCGECGGIGWVQHGDETSHVSAPCPERMAWTR